MSNTSGQATLLDANGAILAQSDPYGTAADGKAWALADGTWYWTNTPTAGASNIIADTCRCRHCNGQKSSYDCQGSNQKGDDRQSSNRQENDQSYVGCGKSCQ